MSLRRSGLNPLAYLGVEPVSPPQLVTEKRDPTNNDVQNVNLGTLWINETTNDVWMLVSLAANVATWALIYPQGGGGSAIVYETDSGSAQESGEILKVLGDSGPISTTGSGNTITVGLSNGTNGQLLIGGGAEAAWNSLTSSDNSVTITTGANSLDLKVAGTSDGAHTFPTDLGTANQSAGTLNVFGDGVNIRTTGSGDTVSVELLNGTNGQLLIGGGSSPQWANLTSTGGTISISNGANSINLEAAGPAGGVIVTTFDASGTWTKNPATKFIKIFAWSGGGGGGAGRRGTGTKSGIDTTSDGGAGGGGASFFSFSTPASFVDTTVSITVGAGGLGGAPQTIDNTNGQNGSQSGASAFGELATFTSSGGLGGQAIRALGGGSSGGVFTEASITKQIAGVTATSLGAGGNGGYDGTNGLDAGFNICVPTGGGGATGGMIAGSGLTPPNSPAGRGGNITGVSGIILAGGTGGTSTSSAGGTGNNAINIMAGGTGGGAGYGQIPSNPTPGNGGAGGFPGGGGGGGGGSINGTNSGAGGPGGQGRVIVVEYL